MSVYVDLCRPVGWQRCLLRPGAVRAKLRAVTQPKRSRWQITNSPKLGFFLGGLWAFIAAGHWWRLASERGEDSSMTLTIILAVLTTLLAAAYLVSATRLRRKQQNRTDH